MSRTEEIIKGLASAMSGADKALGILFFKFDDEDHMARCCRAIHNSIRVRAM